MTLPRSDTRGGLTISRSFAFTDAAGTAQAAPSSSTNTINEQVAVNWHRDASRRNGDIQVEHTSDRTVTASRGQHAADRQRRLEGDGAASGKTEDGPSFTASRVVGDTTTGLVVPLQDGRPTYPTAGTVIAACRRRSRSTERLR